jgi:hypothetical protein
MSELNITAGQLTGRVYAKFEPPLTEEQLQSLKDSDVLLGAEREETRYSNRIIEFRPDWGSFAEHLELEGKSIVLRMGELLASEDVTVVTEEALLDGRDWHFDDPVDTVPIERGVVDSELKRRRSNERAAVTFVNMMGGLGAVYVRDAVHVATDILEADPNDDLSGLRTIADRSFMGQHFGDEPQSEEMPDLAVVSPEAARHWLIKQGRAEELPTGELRIINTDHMTQAGLWIAQQEDSVHFATAYRSMSPDSPLTDDLISEAGAAISRSYIDDLELSRL